MMILGGEMVRSNDSTYTQAYADTVLGSADAGLVMMMH
jgi:hypothetical protein